MMVKPLPLWLYAAALALIALSVSIGPYKIDWTQLAYDVVQKNQTIDTIVFSNCAYRVPSCVF